MRTKKRLEVYAGSLDPLTVGHLWMIEQGVTVLDRLIAAVGINPGGYVPDPVYRRFLKPGA